MIERGTGHKSLMEGSKEGQELGSSLTVCVCSLVCLKVHRLYGGSASPFIDEGAGFTRVRALGCVLYLVLWLTSTRPVLHSNECEGR